MPGTGVILNNEMDDFTAKVGSPNMFGLVQGPQNAIAPGKRMVSSMTPTIVTKDGKLRAVCGSPGRPDHLDHRGAGRCCRSSTTAARSTRRSRRPASTTSGCRTPSCTRRASTRQTAKALAARGHELKSRGRIGHANCIEVDPNERRLRAVADSGRDGGDADAF